jgi:hypothetical protein
VAAWIFSVLSFGDELYREDVDGEVPTLEAVA